MNSNVQAPPRLLTLGQVARRLNVSISTARTYANRDGLPIVRLGAGRFAPIRVEPEALERWIKEWRVRREEEEDPRDAA
jgi:predicted site-specific integrase-resolvase